MMFIDYIQWRSEQIVRADKSALGAINRPYGWLECGIKDQYAPLHIGIVFPLERWRVGTRPPLARNGILGERPIKTRGGNNIKNKDAPMSDFFLIFIFLNRYFLTWENFN
jgi:hypothetical protein